MSNKDFYDRLTGYEGKGLILFMVRPVPKGFFLIKVGNKNVAVSREIAEFAKEIENKVKGDQLFSHKSLEKHLDKSRSFIDAAVANGKYLLFHRGKGLKFYIKKDW